MIYSSDLLAYNAKYFQTLFVGKWRSFANSLPIMLKFRSTVHEFVRANCCVLDNIETQIIRHIALCYANQRH